MTKVTEKMREAAYKEMENFWGDDIDFEEGGKFDGFIVDMFNAMTAAQDTAQTTPYGYCPICGVAGKSRERRLGGYDRCENGHAYPSSDALKEATANAVQVDREDLALVLGNYTFGDHHESNWACNRLLRFLSTEGN